MKFNLTRFSRLIKRDWLVYKKPLGYGFLGLFMLLMGTVLLNVIMNDHESLRISFWFTLYGFFVLGGGALFTSIVYWEFRNQAGRINYLSLPASHFEKVLSRWLYTFVLYPVVLSLLFYLTLKLTEFIDGPTAWDAPLSDYKDYMSLLFLVAHPIIFMFSIWINRYVAPKTAFISLLVFFVFALVFAILLRIVFNAQFDGLEMSGHFRMEPKEGFQDKVYEFWWPLMDKALIAFSMICFWTVAYFKMKEKEV